MPSTLRWFAIQTSTPARTRSRAISAWMSEKPITKSGFSARIASIFALVNAETFGFSLRARGGRTVKPEMPTMRRSSPSAYSTSVGSSVRQTMRCGPDMRRSKVPEILSTVIPARRSCVRKIDDIVRSRPHLVAYRNPRQTARPTDTAACAPTPSHSRSSRARAGGYLAPYQNSMRSGRTTITAPVRRTRHRHAVEALLELGDALLERRAIRQHLRLQRCPRADLAAARARREIRVGLGLGQFSTRRLRCVPAPARASSFQWKQSATCGCAASCAPLRLS